MDDRNRDDNDHRRLPVVGVVALMNISSPKDPRTPKPVTPPKGPPPGEKSPLPKWPKPVKK